VRGLIAGTPIGPANGVAAVAGSAGIAVAGYLWARYLYNHRSAR
jgi:ABC-2 type transport system permease protein